MLLTLSGQGNKTKVCMWVHMRIYGYWDYHYGNDLLRSIMIMFVTMPVIVMTMIWLSRLLPLFHLLFQFIITTGMKAIMVNDISSYHLFVLFINARNDGAGLLGLLSMCVVRWSGRMVDPGMGCGDQAPVPLNIELTKFDRIQILLEIHIAVLSRIVGLS